MKLKASSYGNKAQLIIELFGRAISALLLVALVLTPLGDAFAQETEPPANREPAPAAEIESPPATESDEALFPEETTSPTAPAEEGFEEEEEEAQAVTLNIVGAPGPLALMPEASRPGLSPEIADLSGALLYKYKIRVPPGRGNIIPDLALVYNSAGAANDSVVGSGWSLNIPYIERINRKGSNELFTENYYASSMDGELASTTATTYAPKSEGGSFLKYAFSSNAWTVTDKQGTVYKFGNANSTRQDDPMDSSKVFKWMLEEVRDTNGNYISYEYYKDAGQIYPSRIVYTGNGSTPGVFAVNFDRVSRSSAPTSYATGFSVKSNYRISEIRAEVNNTWARKYALSYTTGDRGAGSLLDTITESGQDDSSTVATLPTIDFDYQTATKGWTYASSWSTIPEAFLGGNYDTGMRMADINGDGLPDVICHNQTSGTSYCNKTNPEVFLNKGDGTWNNVSGTWLFPLIGGTGSLREAFLFSSGGGADKGLRVIDINGDGLADLVRGLVGGHYYIYLNNGSGWTYDASWTMPEAFVDGSADTGVRMGDINGDGLPDLICHNDDTGSGACSRTQPRVYLNTGTSWTDVSSTWLFPVMVNDATKKEAFLDSGLNDRGLRLVDINGDGLADLVRGYVGGHYYIYLNNGSGWTYDASWAMPEAFISSGADTGVRMADINGDNLPDVLCRNDNTSAVCSRTNPLVTLDTGTSWTNVSATWLFPLVGGAGSIREYFLTGASKDSGLRILDINGDGFPDLLRGNGSYVYLNNTSVQSDLLKKVTYAQGGSTAITYKASPQYRSGSMQLSPSLPIIFDVVDQLTTNDGLGTAESYSYEYEGGYYYFNTPLDRKFAGFASIKATDGVGNVKRVYYHQGNGTNTSLGEYSDHASKIGRPYRVEEYDSSGNLYRLTVDKVDKYNLGTGRDFVKVVRRTVLDYDGDSDHADTAAEFTYDNTYGNLTEKTDWGKVTASTDGSFTDTGSDKSVETVSYVANTSNYVVGLPYQDTVLDQSGNKVRESKTYYDTLSLGSVGAGNPTKTEEWVSGSTYINSQKAYNTTYGIVTSATDTRGKVTSYTYDSYNLYPATTTDPLAHTTQYTYDYSLGKPKQVTDQNGFVYQTVYDGLDRVKEEKVPGLVSPYSPVTRAAYAYTDTANAVKVQRTDYLDSTTSVDTYQYFDGLGRLIQERKEAEAAGSFNVRDIAYDSRGLVLKESLPYTSSGSSKTSATGTASLDANYIYDPLRRPFTVVNALGTTSYVYDDWKTTATDANGKVKRYYKDARGNLAKVDEVNGGSTYVTTYDWSLNGKLTKITDALGNARNFTYDGLGRRLTAEDLHAPGDATYGTWTYAYDNAGNLTQTISPRALTTNYTYNDVNQVLSEDYTGGVGTEMVYTYGGCANGVGKLCAVAMLSGANTAYAYDSNGGIASEAKTTNGTTYATSYAYDRQGNIVTLTYPDSAEVKYTFNAAGLLEKIERKESGGAFTNVVSNFDYGPTGQPTVQAYANGVTTTNAYDAAKLYRLTRRLTQNASSTKLQDLNYTYDAVGNVTQLTDASNTDGAKTAAYTYDDLHRLTSATITNAANGSNYVHTYAYNALGNITSGLAGTYLYQGDTGSFTANPHAATSVNGATYAYDSDGNLVSNAILTNTWNYRDQLVQTVNGSTTVNYYYDHNGDRVLYIMNGATYTAYPNKYYNSVGSTQTKQIYAGDGLVATVETVSAVVTPYYVHTDQLGSTNAVSDGAGALVQTLDYYPFGAQRISSGAYNEQRQYIGQIYDADTGLDYLNARYYEGSRGQFLSQDPVFWEVGRTSNGKVILGSPQLLNSYAYAAGNPITGKDADGRLVELFSRPIQGSLGVIGAHSFVTIIPENSKTIGTLPGVDTSRPFTLGGYTNGTGDLFKAANAGSDYTYAFGSMSNVNGVSQIIIDPPAGMTKEEFDRRVLQSYGALPDAISGSYGFMGQSRLTGNPNSNNVATDILLGAGVSQGEINSYQRTLFVSSFPRIAPGLGTSASAPTYSQSARNNLSVTLGALKVALTKLQGILGSNSKKP